MVTRVFVIAVDGRQLLLQNGDTLKFGLVVSDPILDISFVLRVRLDLFVNGGNLALEHWITLPGGCLDLMMIGVFVFGFANATRQVIDLRRLLGHVWMVLAIAGAQIIELSLGLGQLRLERNQPRILIISVKVHNRRSREELALIV